LKKYDIPGNKAVVLIDEKKSLTDLKPIQQNFGIVNKQND